MLILFLINNLRKYENTKNINKKSKSYYAMLRNGTCSRQTQQPPTSPLPLD